MLKKKTRLMIIHENYIEIKDVKEKEDFIYTTDYSYFIPKFKLKIYIDKKGNKYYILKSSDIMEIRELSKDIKALRKRHELENIIKAIYSIGMRTWKQLLQILIMGILFGAFLHQFYVDFIEWLYTLSEETVREFIKFGNMCLIVILILGVVIYVFYVMKKRE